MRNRIRNWLIVIALLVFAGAAAAGDREGSATRKDLAGRTLTIDRHVYPVGAETRLEDLDGVRISLAQFPVADALESATGQGEAIVSVVYEASGSTLTRARIIPTGG